MKRLATTSLENIMFSVQTTELSSILNVANSTKFAQGVIGVIGGEPKLLGIHGSQYTLSPNEKFVGNILHTLDSNGIKYNTEVYNQHNTRFNVRVILEGIKFSFTNDKGQTRDNLSPMLEIKNSYDGSVSPSFSMSTYRQICSNGMIGLQVVSSIRKKATKQVLYAFDSVPSLIDEFITTFENQGIVIERLAAKKVQSVEEKICAIAEQFDLFKTHTMSKGVITGYTETIEQIANVVYTESNALGEAPNNWLIYNGLNQWLFSLENSITEPNREKIDTEIVRSLLAEVE